MPHEAGNHSRGAALDLSRTLEGSNFGRDAPRIGPLQISAQACSAGGASLKSPADRSADVGRRNVEPWPAEPHGTCASNAGRNLQFDAARRSLMPPPETEREENSAPIHRRCVMIITLRQKS